MKRIAVLVLVFALSLSLFSCGNSAENSGCEAFEFMSDGEYALTLAIGEDGDHGVLIYSEHNGVVALRELDESGENGELSWSECLFFPSGSYVLDLYEKTYTDFVSIDISYGLLHFDKKLYKFSKKESADGKDIYVFKRGKNNLEFTYENGTLIGLKFTPYIDGKLVDRWALAFTVWKIEDEYDDRLIYEIPEGYEYVTE